MPLNVIQLQVDIEDISNKAADGGETDWIAIADAIQRYAMTMQYPPPIGVIPGMKLIKPILGAIKAPTGPLAPVLLRVSFLLLGLSIQIGMPIGTGLAPTRMPSSPPNFDAVFKGPQDAKQFAQNLSREIDSWLRKGKFDVGFVGGSGPVPILIPWS